MTTITAAVARELGKPLVVEQLELDAIRPNEARVRLVATGVCHTDAIVRDGVYPTPLPAVLGHEGAGVVEEIGSAVTTVKPGDHVVLAAAYCTHCVQCRSGRGAYCENLFAQDFGGRREDGTTSLTDSDGREISSHFFGQSSFGAYANVVESSLVKVPQTAPLEILAPLGCGLNTGAGAVLNELRPPAGSSFVVTGAGASGSVGRGQGARHTRHARTCRCGRAWDRGELRDRAVAGEGLDVQDDHPRQFGDSAVHPAPRRALVAGPLPVRHVDQELLAGSDQRGLRGFRLRGRRQAGRRVLNGSPGT